LSQRSHQKFRIIGKVLQESKTRREREHRHIVVRAQIILDIALGSILNQSLVAELCRSVVEEKNDQVASIPRYRFGSGERSHILRPPRRDTRFPFPGQSRRSSLRPVQLKGVNGLFDIIFVDDKIVPGEIRDDSILLVGDDGLRAVPASADRGLFR